MSAFDIIFSIVMILLSVAVCVTTLSEDKSEKSLGITNGISDVMKQNAGNLAKMSMDKLIVGLSTAFLLLGILDFVVNTLAA